MKTLARKQCTCCLKTKRASQFSRASGTRDGLHSHCRSCRSDYGRSLAGRASSLLKAAKRRAKAKGIKCTLTLDWVKARLGAMTCEETGWMFVLRKGTHPFAPSIDRINAAKGYTPANCRMVLLGVNTMKGTLEASIASATSPIQKLQEVEREQIELFALALAIRGQELPVAA